MEAVGAHVAKSSSSGSSGGKGRLADKVAIVTGAAGTIGSATAQLFLVEGASVLLVDISSDTLASTVDRVVAASGVDKDAKVAVFAADLTKEESIKEMIDAAVNKWGKVDILFNNAGIAGKAGTIETVSAEDFDKVIAVNVRAVWLGMKHVIPVMAKNGTIAKPER
jgi:3alpha(or 20beta)-hydroxysteroid dehydrogenase